MSGPQGWGGEHTAVRTEDDSGFDTLWLLKKMDSRSRKVQEEKLDCGGDKGPGSVTRHQGAASAQPQRDTRAVWELRTPEQKWWARHWEWAPGWFSPGGCVSNQGSCFSVSSGR